MNHILEGSLPQPLASMDPAAPLAAPAAAPPTPQQGAAVDRTGTGKAAAAEADRQGPAAVPAPDAASHRLRVRRTDADGRTLLACIALRTENASK